MSYGEDMCDLMARGLHSPVLNFSRYFRSEYSLVLALLCGEIRVMSSITLNADPPRLLCHSKNKCPPVFWIEISVSQHQKTLILLKFYIFLQVIENMTCMELLHMGVRSDSCGHDFFLLKNCQALLNGWSSSRLPIWLLIPISLWFDSKRSHSSEKDLENWFHIINKHFLKISFLLPENLIFLLLPHLKYDTFINIPIPHVRFKVL